MNLGIFLLFVRVFLFSGTPPYYGLSHNCRKNGSTVGGKTLEKKSKVDSPARVAQLGYIPMTDEVIVTTNHLGYY